MQASPSNGASVYCGSAAGGRRDCESVFDASSDEGADSTADWKGLRLASVQTFMRALRLFAMVVWVGGLCFFAFVVAPVAFGSLPSAHDAGLVVGGTLRVLHWIGLVGGMRFLPGDGVVMALGGGSGAGGICDSA